jgi:hypothetical protein
MASKQDRIAEKARARKKARDRERHRVAASKRQHMSKTRDISVEEAAAWPLAECYVGDKWHEDGARIPAIFVRKHPSGRVMAASMDVDLAEQGVVDLELWALQTVNELNMKLAALSQDTPLLVVPAELVVRIARVAYEHGVREEYEQPEDWAKVELLFGDVTPGAGTPDVRAGRGGDSGAAPSAPSTAAEPEGLWGKLKARLGF